jgi:hypothetical protein
LTFLSLRYILQNKLGKKMFWELNSDVSNPGTVARKNAYIAPGKTRLSSEKAGADEITIHVISRSSGKPVVARAAHAMASDPRWRQERISVQDLNAILEGDSYLSEPARLLSSSR